jgi:serine O-acetyltransferase
LLNPGYRCLFLQRIQEALNESGFFLAEQLVLNLNHVMSGAEFRPGSRIGPGAIVRHPTGIVIGTGVTTGANCIFLQGVTIGERYVDDRSDGLYPSVGSNVVFGANAVVIGNITICDDVVVRALTLVDHDVNDRSTATGAEKT